MPHFTSSFRQGEMRQVKLICLNIFQSAIKLNEKRERGKKKKNPLTQLRPNALGMLRGKLNYSVICERFTSLIKM